MVLFERGWFMDRPPLSLHGVYPEPVSQIGCTILYWNTGPGTSRLDAKAAEESIDVPFAGNLPAVRNDFVDGLVFDTATAPWQPHPEVAGWKWKPLTGIVAGDGPVSLVFIPPEWHPVGVEWEASTERHRWMYALAGELRLTLAEDSGHQTVAVREGTFVGWQGPTRLGIGERASDTGCTLMCVGHRLAG